MNPRIAYVEEILGFLFEQGFARKFEELGSPPNDLEFWYRNAVVFAKATWERPVAESQRRQLVTLIEAIRFDAMFPSPFGEQLEFDLTAYDFSEDIRAYKELVIAEVLHQESESLSSIDPAPSPPRPLN